LRRSIPVSVGKEVISTLDKIFGLPQKGRVKGGWDKRKEKRNDERLRRNV